jgi:thiosulfate/3-mercaptopyruvate sulfurtransferase
MGSHRLKAPDIDIIIDIIQGRFAMKRLGLIVFVLLFFVASPLFALEVPSTHLVSAKWLAKNMDNPHLVIVDVRTVKDYEAGHIPHAVNIPKGEYFQKASVGDIEHVLDTPEMITGIFRKAGLSNNSIVVFYSSNASQNGYTFATREFWTAWMYGLHNTALLHGGIEAWTAQKNPISKESVQPKTGSFTVEDMSLDSIATWPDIYYALATKKVELVDAREPAHFNGTDNDKRLLKHGHIPGAVAVPTYDFVKKHGSYYALISSDAAKALLNKYKVSLHKPVIDYCNTGHLASGDWFAIKFLAGARHIRMYDASMYEYTRTSLPVEK